jgi:glycerophosphoryl diester phosphodiesterase
VNVWTVDDPAVAEELSSWGVNYITTNILEDADE